MIINASDSDWQQQILQHEMDIVQKTMTDKFYDIFEKTYQNYVDKFYSEYTPKIYPRSKQLRNVLPVEIKPIINGNTVICGIDLGQVQRLNHSFWKSGRFSGYHYGNKGDSFAMAIVEDALLDGGHGFQDPTQTAPFVEMENELTNDENRFVNLLKDELSRNGFIVM